MLKSSLGYFALLCGALLSACSHGQEPTAAHGPAHLVAEESVTSTIGDRFPTPAGFTRSQWIRGGFEYHLRSLPLKPQGAQVHLFDGSLKRFQGAQAAVIDISVGTKDLQQCADAVMRLRAEFLFAADRKNEITFNFTSGFKAPFARWMKGERIRVQGNDCSWVPTGKIGASHDALMDYLQVIFTYAGTASLSKELKDCSSSPLQPGDVFIQGGHPGHAVIVVDVAENSAGEQLFLLAQSYMPAQEIHVLKNLEDAALSPWFKLNDGHELVTPEWTFRWDHRKQWR